MIRSPDATLAGTGIAELVRLAAAASGVPALPKAAIGQPAMKTVADEEYTPPRLATRILCHSSSTISRALSCWA
jgi:hypothetical protein